MTNHLKRVILQKITINSNMKQTTFTDKNGNEWSWEETAETIEALKQLHETVKQVNDSKTTTVG